MPRLPAAVSGGGRPLPTVPAKRLLTRTKSRDWFGNEYNMNIYRGCTHGCIYCDSRSDCYRDPDFDTVKVKENALALLRDDLRRALRPGVVGTGSMSDPYNPHERELELTRHALELLAAYGFGVSIATKSPLVARDADVLGELAEYAPALVKMTVTAADPALSRLLEPGAAPAAARFEALRGLSDAGIYCGVLMMPLLPWITDSEENVLAIVRMAAESGARFVYPALGLTMRDGQREYLYRALDRHFPGMRARYRQRYGTRYRCSSPRAGVLWRCFTAECERLGLLYEMREIERGYRMGYAEQMGFSSLGADII